jgi:hypothetical protein
VTIKDPKTLTVVTGVVLVCLFALLALALVLGHVW